MATGPTADYIRGVKKLEVKPVRQQRMTTSPNMAGDIYAGGTRTNLPSKYAFYDYIRANPSLGAREFSSNPWGVSATEIQSLINQVSGGAARPLSSGYGSGGTTDQDALLAGQLRPEVRAKIAELNQVYDSLFGQYDRIAQDARSRQDQEYTKNAGQLSEQFSKSAAGLRDAYSSRGLTDSSFQAVAQGDNLNTYNTGLEDLNQQRINNLAEIGSTYAQQRAGTQAQRDYYNNLNLDSITSGAQLQDIQNSILDSLTNSRAALGGAGTQQDYINRLNAVTVRPGDASSKMSTLLANLVNTSAPSAAKNEIAQGLIKRSQLDTPEGAQYWEDYYQKLLNQQQGA